ncbi:MAG: nucleotide exchange factor GrpE, partial [Planctomycetota bacterium]
AEAQEKVKGHDGEEYEDSTQNAALSLANCVEALIGRMLEKAIERTNVELGLFRSELSHVLGKQQATLELTDEKLAPLSAQLAKLQTGQQQISYSLERVEERLEQLNAESKLLENASRENRLLTEEHYENHVFQPMVRSLFPAFDLLDDAQNGIAERTEDSDKRTQQLIEGILIQLGQFLSAYGVERIEHKPGAKFDPAEMSPVKTVTTHDKRLDNRVGKSLRAGFRGPQQRLLRTESVALYRYREPKLMRSEK